jgi:alpha-galactosidase
MGTRGLGVEPAAAFVREWAESFVMCPSRLTVSVESRKCGWRSLQLGKSVHGNRLKLGGREYVHGLGSHADSEIVVRAGGDLARFRATAGIDENAGTLPPRHGDKLKIVFSVEAGGRSLWRSAEMNVLSGGVEVDVALPKGTREIVLRAVAANGNNSSAHTDWAEARLVRSDGTEVAIQPALESPPVEPFSFTYGGRRSSELLAAWPARRKGCKVRNGVVDHEIVWSDPKSGLECRLELREDTEFPALEWVLYFRNAGKHDTAILEDIQALDANWYAPEEVVSLYRSIGSRCKISDFEYTRETLLAGASVAMVGGGGRSSDQWLPFFNLEMEKRGVITAIGWSGQWACRYQRGAGSLRVTAGMEKTHLKLHPGEEIRSPRILQFVWNGDRIEGHNALRRFLLRRHSPMHKGKVVAAPFTTAHWGGMKTAGHLERIAVYQKQRLPLEYYWVDAGWYGLNSTYSPDEHTGDWARHVGDWRVNPKAHPQGLKPVSDAAGKAGMNFLLWIEPERAIWGTQWTREHPDWFLGRRADGSNVLLNLGNPAALRGAIELVSAIIRANRVGCYRQDFNMAPLNYWRENDAPDRVGMTEIGHITGLYKFWDALLKRHPGLVIDNCSSGGRRIDLETIRRSIPLWQSDWQCWPNNDPIGGQTHGMGLNYWIPLHGTGTYNSMPTAQSAATYRFRSSLGPALQFSAFPYESTPIDPRYPWDWYRRMAADYLRVRPLFLGDYYPLTEANADPAQWAAFQMHRADLGEGFILALRRSEAPWTGAQFCLRGLDPDAVYELEDADTGKKMRRSGRELAETGLGIRLPKTNTSALVFYRE